MANKLAPKKTVKILVQKKPTTSVKKILDNKKRKVLL